jgi:hypothetical protein
MLLFSVLGSWPSPFFSAPSKSTEAKTIVAKPHISGGICRAIVLSLFLLFAFSQLVAFEQITSDHNKINSRVANLAKKPHTRVKKTNISRVQHDCGQRSSRAVSVLGLIPKRMNYTAVFWFSIL